MPKPIVLTWDWKESPGEVIEDVIEALDKLPGPTCAFQHDTRGDYYCLVLSSGPLSPDEVAAAHDSRWDDEED